MDQLILMDPAKRIDGMQGAIVSDDTHLHKVEISESMYPTVDDVIQNLIQRALEPFEAEAGRLSPEEEFPLLKSYIRMVCLCSREVCMPWQKRLKYLSPLYIDI